MKASFRAFVLVLVACELAGLRIHPNCHGALLEHIASQPPRVVTSAGATAVIYVDDHAPLGGNGATWPTAFRHLQDALRSASAGAEIRIAAGLYHPDRDEGGHLVAGDRTAAFKLINGVTVAGGYRGIDPATPGNPDDRDVLLFESVLSGDLSGNDGTGPTSADDNSYHIFYHPVGLGLDATAVLEGVVIRDAYANGPSTPGHDTGAGMYNNENSPTVSHCTFRLNWATGGGGGGMYNRNCAPAISYCTFSDNYGFDGGGMLNFTAQPLITHCHFANNEASDGGAISNYRSEVTLFDSTFHDNNAVSAGAIYDFDGQLEIGRCAFERNAATYEYAQGGGAILLYESHALVTDSQFVENSAPLGGGIAFTQASSGMVVRSTFDRNVAEWPAYGGDGGAIAIQWGDGVSVIDCDFRENQCDGDGGALVNYDAPSTVLNCRFGRNQAMFGGAVYIHGSTMVLANSSLAGNLAEDGGAVYFSEADARAINCTVHGNAAKYSAGGIYIVRGNPIVTNNILWGNSDWSGEGESAQVSDSPSSQRPWHPSFSCIQGLDAFTGHGNIGENPRLMVPPGANAVTGTGDEDVRLSPGSPCIDAGDNTVIPRDTFDLDSDADTSEPLPIDLGEGSRFLDDPCISDTGPSDPKFGPFAIVDMGAFERAAEPAADPDGDGPSNCEDNCPTHPNPDQADCDSDGVGDACVLAYCVDDPACSDCNANGVPDACDIAGGVADVDGNGKPDACQRVWYVDDDAAPGGDGLSWPSAFRYLQDAMHVAALGDEIRVAGGTYHPDFDEGGIVTYGSRGSTFRLIDGAALIGGHRGCPGGDCTGGDPDELDRSDYESVLNGIVAHDDPANDAWCLHVVMGIGTSSKTLIDGFTIRNGYSNLQGWPDDRGAGMFLFRASPTVDHCTIFNNYSNVGNVAGVWAYHSASIFRNSTFRRNFGWDFGGALANDSSTTTIIGCLFEENDALDGGAIYNWNSETTIIDSTFRSNTAMYGGGAVCDNGSDTIMRGCLIDQNRAELTYYSSGGGISSNYGSRTTLERCVISRNVANGFWDGFGGGIDVGYQSEVVVDRCMVVGNSADHGGAIYASGDSVTVVNSVVAGNRAMVDGGALNSFDTPGTFRHTTFAANTAPSGAILYHSEDQYLPTSIAEFDHCILQNASGVPWLAGSPQPVVSFSAVDDGAPLDGMVFPGEGNIDELVTFVREPADGSDGFGDDPATEEVDESANDDYGDLRLQPGSAGIDDGEPAFIPEPGQADFDGHSRVLCGRVDMGAFEFGIGDYDCDGAVDNLDFAMWNSCATAPGGGPYPTGCENFDFDFDGDVDLADYSGLVDSFGDF